MYPAPVTAAVRSVLVLSRYWTVKPEPLPVPVITKLSETFPSFWNRTWYVAVDPLTTPRDFTCTEAVAS